MRNKFIASPVLSESCIVVSLRIEMLKGVRYVPANLLSDLCRTTMPVTIEGDTLRAWSSDY